MTPSAPAPSAAEEALRQLAAESAEGPLAGLLIADFSRVLAGPYATQLMADLGATVVKVESPAGDETRSWSPPERDGVSTYYLGINRNKYDVVLDFRDEGDRSLALELARRADVVIENFKPGGLQKFGLDYESVAAVNPAVIYASISGFGSKKGATLPGYDLIVQAASGLMSLTGSPDGPAYRSGVSVFDIMTGMQATIGILAALNHRTQTGDGQHIEVNLLSTALSAMANHSSTYVAGGTIPFRMGNAHPSLFPYEPLPASDGEIIIVAANDRQFAKLAAAIGRSHLADDERFTTTEERNRNRGELRLLLVDALAAHTAAEWFDILTDAGIACGPINTIDGGVALAERLGLDPIVQVGEGEQSVPMIRNPITFSRTQPRYDSPPPALGQDDGRIRAWLSGTPDHSDGGFAND
ncbi:CaiB/BaiF CoA transferase family protein [Paramicrobacterium agarici]|uniref:Crotonobetainyl-CoA:carnitine CoA-transferase CaiB-like acyl-CoA transferase n=1 Tax=Paramicrobacterium agarici TaxID=630514 RepID=A0A2A9DUX4_9MICO|nr:CoA transferase [Microbacterium agarici]PFG29709.1 crotonobetainyl-CoA:carnitine CoA-transferase CaiB-like acyl-CoA transferase [Microbacterium agarici]